MAVSAFQSLSAPDRSVRLIKRDSHSSEPTRHHSHSSISDAQQICQICHTLQQQQHSKNRHIPIGKAKTKIALTSCQVWWARPVHFFSRLAFLVHALWIFRGTARARRRTVPALPCWKTSVECPIGWPSLKNARVFRERVKLKRERGVSTCSTKFNDDLLQLKKSIS